eukprot:Skav201903  [mRNA]  locus=scaffold3992:11450:20578:- [translate_table: standard]
MEHQLASARPEDLPSPTEDDRVPVVDGRVDTGKGRGGSTYSGAASKPGQGDACYETPPSNNKGLLSSLEVGQDRLGPSLQTEGPMTDEDVLASRKVRRTMGTIPAAGETRVPDAAEEPQPPGDVLQRALERAMVDSLKEENERLSQELARLKGENRSSTHDVSSASSWSVIPGSGQHDSKSGGVTGRRVDCGTPRQGHQSMDAGGKQAARFTPGGTQVPDGPPPDDEMMVVPTPPPLPPLPVMDASMRDDYDDYERVAGDVKRGRLGEAQWAPRPPRAPQPHEARTFWMEREIQALQAALMNQKGDSGFRDSPYWSQPWNAGSRDDPTIHDVVDRNSRYRNDQAAGSVLGEHRPEVRAPHVGDEHAHGDKVCQGDRAQHVAARGDIDRGSRAPGMMLGDHRLQDRAGSARDCGPPGDRADSRAAMGEMTAQALRQAAQELEERARFNQEVEARRPYSDAVDQYKRTPGGYGFGYDTTASPLDPKSPFWIPPPGGGHDVTLVRDGQDDRGMTAWEGGSGGTRIELPVLPADSSPLGLGDWLTVITPLMRDVSQVTAIWWELTKGHAMALYKQWKQSTPLERVAIAPELPPELREPRFTRTEQRGTSLLLRALPEELQQTLIAAREMSSTAILYRLLVRFQPGGSGEKALLLQKLTCLEEAKDMVAVTSSLRTWRRHFQRALEVGAVVPDGTLLLQAMETAVQQIAAKDSQASFRLAQARSQIGVDEHPTQDNVWRLSQCILAEAETLSLLSSSATSTPVPSTPVKVKQMDATPTTPSPGDPPSGGKPRRDPSTTPCKRFRSDGGCRAGVKCKFSHSWEGVADKNERCWVCGSKDHRKAECAVRAHQPSKSDPGAGSGGGSGGSGRGRGGDKDGKDGRGNGKGGKPSGGAAPGGGGSSSTPASSTTTTKTGDGNAADKPKVNEMTTSPSGQASQDGGGQKVGGGPTKVGAADLLVEATHLLKSLRMPSMQVMKLTRMADDEKWVLLDSGATHGLRPAHDWDEWMQGVPTRVSLADGETNSLKLKEHTRVLLADPTTTTSWIVPLGGVADMGYSFEWKGSRCTLSHRQLQETIEVMVQDGCPMIPMNEGKRILEKMEEEQRTQDHRVRMVKALTADLATLDPKELTMDLAMMVRLRTMFPHLPEEVLTKTVPAYDASMAADLGHRLPWNRRKRRRLQRADNLIVHFYSGACGQFWEKELGSHTTEVLCLDLLAPVPSDLMDPAVFWYVMSLMMSGRVKAILAGPPCRTVSALRFQGDDGPGVIRDEVFPWGRPDITDQDAELVLADSALWLRVLLSYSLAEEARLELRPTAPATALVLEQPEDPARYRSAQDVERFHYMSMWRTAEWALFQAQFKVDMIHLDQGAMGHQVRKPTTLAVVLPAMKELDGIRGAPEQVPTVRRQDLTLQERYAMSKTWAAWAPGMKAAIVVALRQWLHNEDRSSLVPGRDGRGAQCSIRVRPLGPVALEQWKQHYLHDHYPARRDCAQCVRAAARGRPHRRVEHAEAFTLGIDLTGKLTPGKDQEGADASYLLVAVYTFPVTKQGTSLVPLPGQPEPQDQPLPSPGESLEDDTCLEEMPSGIPGEAAVDVVETDVEAGDRFDGPPGDDPDDVEVGEDILQEVFEQDEAPSGGDAIRVEAMESANTTWRTLIQENKNVAVKNLTFTEPLRSRATHHVIPAIARVYARLRQLNLPVMRIHTDRAKEFRSGQMRRWTLDRSIVHTMTAADDWKANGRVENEIQQVKKLVKVLISSNKCDLHQWPLAARHASERRLRSQLRAVGWPVGDLLPFGSTAFSLRKWWQNRYEAWRENREPVTVLGPAKFSSLTSTSYYVVSKNSGQWFYTSDVIIPDENQPMQEERVIYLPEQAPEELQHQPVEVPTHRVRGKQAPPPQVHQLWPLDVCHEGPAADLPSGDESSWTLATQPSSASDDQGALEEEFGVCGGEMEGVPNTWAGGSHPGTPFQRMHRMETLDQLHQNLNAYLQDEMAKLDATDEVQASWLPVLTNAIKEKTLIEAQLHHLHMVEMDQQLRKADEEFLVTRTVSNQEVYDHFDDWKEAITNEFRQLVEIKQAVEPVTKEELTKRADQEALDLEILPAKMVFTRKAGTGAYRARAVICGNYSSDKHQDDVYAGGIDATQIRCQLQVSAAQGWTCASTDIRVAFLNAPRRRDSKLVAMQVPHVFKRLGLCQPGEDFWIVRLAMYGLTTSPRDWGVHRDRRLPQLRWRRWADDSWRVGWFEPTGDPHLWRAVERGEAATDVADVAAADEAPVKHWVGLLGVYVDDILLTGQPDAVQSAFGAIESEWATSGLEWRSVDKAIKFLGFEIRLDKNNNGLRVGQESYIQEVLNAWDIKEGTKFPQFKVCETDFEVEEGANMEDVKTAQAMCGALLWIATRTRPDLSYGVSSMSRIMAKRPSRAVAIGRALLRYLWCHRGGLHYPTRMEHPWGSTGQLKRKRHAKTIEVFADISYGVGSGGKSVQGLVICVGGAPVSWQSSQQPYVCQSTSESELTSYCEALNVGRATEALLAAIYQIASESEELDRIIYGDNLSSIGIARGEAAATWRTRHLKLRSSLLREALDPESSAPGGRWSLLHLRGNDLMADGLTKALQGQAFSNFLINLGIQVVEESQSVKGSGTPMANRIALQAVLVGSTLMSCADAVGEGDDDMDEAWNYVWAGAAVLMAIGAVQVGRTVANGVNACLKRMKVEEPVMVVDDQPESDDSVIEVVKGPTSLKSRKSLLRSGSAAQQDECATSRPLTGRSGSAAQQDECATSRPLTGRSGSAAQQDECATSRPLTGRSGSAAQQDECATSRPLTGRSGSAAQQDECATSWPSTGRSGSAAQQDECATSRPLTGCSGSAAQHDEGATSWPSTGSSGLASVVGSGPMTMPMSTASGSAMGGISRNSKNKQGKIDGARSTMSMSRSEELGPTAGSAMSLPSFRSGDNNEESATTTRRFLASSSAALDGGESATSLLNGSAAPGAPQREGSTLLNTSVASSSGVDRSHQVADENSMQHMNSWNRFQHMNRGRGWNSSTMSKYYQEWKRHGKMP